MKPYRSLFQESGNDIQKLLNNSEIKFKKFNRENEFGEYSSIKGEGPFIGEIKITEDDEKLDGVVIIGYNTLLIENEPEARENEYIKLGITPVNVFAVVDDDDNEIFNQIPEGLAYNDVEIVTKLHTTMSLTDLYSLGFTGNY